MCKKENIDFKLVRNISDTESQNLINQSFLSVDLRGPWHKECGYLPCRIFKNNSYGRITGTNSENVKKVFGDFVVFDENPITLFSKLKETEEKVTLNSIKKSMLFIKDKHTFINRVQNLLKVL